MVKRTLAIALSLGTCLVAETAAAQLPQEQVVLVNESVRVVILTLRPGAGTGIHAGLEPELGLVLEGELTLLTPSGQETLPAGRMYWLPSLTRHDVRNEGERPAKLLDILLKRCE